MKHRPEYHFLPVKNWMNDPNGPIYYEGEYHLFYQYNPTDWHWGNLHWGHATSKDLLHWDHKPIALYPAHDRGESHCYSGCSYVKDGKLELFYTSIGPVTNQQNNAQQWVATTEDHITWNQIEENPVLKTQDHDFQISEWRDPFVFRYKGESLMMMAGIIDDRYGAIHVYRSEDMRNWDYMNVFYGDDVATVYECPNIAIFGDKLVLLRSVMNNRNVRYYVGTLNEDYTFQKETEGDIDFGEYFATNISYAADGAVLLWGWIREDCRGNIVTDGEWAGVQSIPRILTLDNQNRIRIHRLPGLDMLRRSEESATLHNFSGRHRFATESSTCEVRLSVTSSVPFAISVLCASENQGREHTDIVIDPQKGTLTAVLDQSSLLTEVDKNPIRATIEKPEDGKFEIDILVDNSTVEVFMNEMTCLTFRSYPVQCGKSICFSSEHPVDMIEATVYDISL